MLRNIISPWIFLAMAGLAIVLLAALVTLVWLSRPTPALPGPATAILTRIPAPTTTIPGSTPTSDSFKTATPNAGPSPLPGTLAVGAFVQIVGTGGDGLRLRTGPGLDNEIRFLGLESEVFEVKDGPQVSDDFTWWFLVAPLDENRNGWAVSPYLVVIENP